MRVGRNDPCPCGSGKKYKRCCLKDGPDEMDQLVSLLRAGQRDVESRMAEFAAEMFGREVPSGARAAFALGTESLADDAN